MPQTKKVKPQAWEINKPQTIKVKPHTWDLGSQCLKERNPSLSHAWEINASSSKQQS